MLSTPQSKDLIPELEFTTSRSGGPGGQNVNKVNSKVTLRFDVRNSVLLNEDQKLHIAKRLGARMTKDGVLLLTSQDDRSQLQNKENVLAKFDQLMVKAFFQRKTRKKTKPGKSAKQERLREKKHRSEKKKWRSNRPE